MKKTVKLISIFLVGIATIVVSVACHVVFHQPEVPKELLKK